MSQSEEPRFEGNVVALPPMSERQVLGTWLISEPGMHMTRSIEVVGGEYYMVMRVTGVAGEQVGGNEGLRLAKVSESEFKGYPPNSMIYRIGAMGELLCQPPFEEAACMRGVPCTDLWPQ